VRFSGAPARGEPFEAVTEETVELKLPSRIEAIGEAAAAVVDAARRLGFAEDALFGIDLAVREAVTNAVLHGNRQDESVPVEVGMGNLELKGESSDLSEDGAKISMDGFGIQPEPGDSVDLRIELEDGDIVVKGEVIRVAARGARWFLSTRFLDIKEKDQDRVRRRVFQALREERARLSD